VGHVLCILQEGDISFLSQSEIFNFLTRSRSSSLLQPTSFEWLSIDQSKKIMVFL